MINNLIGNTPLIKIKYEYNGQIKNIYTKLEFYNLSGSIKDRVAYYMINKAKEKGIISEDAADTLIILSSTDSSVDSSNTFFTYDEISNIEDSDYGLYTLGRGLSTDKLSLISPRDSINQTGELTGN